MLHIILVILKIIGILLAAILLLVLLAVCSVLFVPLRYRVNAAKDDTGIRAWGRVSWLLHLVTVTAEYKNGKPALKVRILFLKKNLMAGEKEPSKQQKKAQSSGRSIRKKEPEAIGKQTASVDIPEKREEPCSPVQQNKKEQEPPKVPETKKKPSLLRTVLEKLKGILEKIKEFWKKLKSIPQKIRRFMETGKASIQKVQDWVSFLRSDMVKSVFCRFKQHLLYLWKHLKPDKIWGDMHYGFDDPSLTGQLTGILYMLLPVGCYEIRLHPDFDSAVCEGEIHIKGHIRICHLARIGWKVFWDKEFRKILRKFQS